MNKTHCIACFENRRAYVVAHEKCASRGKSTIASKVVTRTVTAALILLGGLEAVQAQPKAPQAQQAPINSATQAAMQQGVQACAARINQVSSFLGFGSAAGGLLMVPPSGQDQRMIPLVMEVPTPLGEAYVSSVYAPNQANGCGASYDAVVYWPQKCDAVASKQFGAMKKVGLLKKSITILDGGVATKVFLMQAGSGCVSIKKEVVL